VVLAINLGEDRGTLANWVKSRNVTSTVLVLDNPALGQSYAITATPTGTWSIAAASSWQGDRHPAVERRQGPRDTTSAAGAITRRQREATHGIRW